MSQLYHAEILRRMEPLLNDPSNYMSDRELAETLTNDGCPCSTAVIQHLRTKHGWASLYKRIKTAKQAAHDMVANQPINMG